VWGDFTSWGGDVAGEFGQGAIRGARGKEGKDVIWECRVKKPRKEKRGKKRGGGADGSGVCRRRELLRRNSCTRRKKNRVTLGGPTVLLPHSVMLRTVRKSEKKKRVAKPKRGRAGGNTISLEKECLGTCEDCPL